MNERQADFLEAIKTGDRAQVEALLSAEPDLVNSRSSGGLSAVLAAAYYNEPDILRLLLERGARLNIFEAAAAGSLADVQSLLAADPELINQYASDGFQPLGLAAFFGHAAIAAFLIEAGAEVDSPSRNPMRVRPLHSAAASGQVEIAGLLLARGADPNASQADNFVPLHAAAQNGQVEMIRLLRSYGADPSLKNAQGLTAADIARQAGHLEILEELNRE